MAQLNAATSKLTDANPNNDAVASTHLQNFLDQVEAKRNNGHLTGPEADGLRDDALAIQLALGC